MIELTDIEKEKVLACVRFIANDFDIQEIKLNTKLSILSNKESIVKTLDELDEARERAKFYNSLYRKLRLMWR